MISRSDGRKIIQRMIVVDFGRVRRVISRRRSRIEHGIDEVLCGIGGGREYGSTEHRILCKKFLGSHDGQATLSKETMESRGERRQESCYISDFATSANSRDSRQSPLGPPLAFPHYLISGASG
jgi:hypothetical protein